MKKLVLSLVLVAVVGWYRAPFLLAEDKADTAAIKKVVENYFGGIQKGDLDSIMGQISTNYSGPNEEGIATAVDYSEFKSVIQSRLSNYNNSSFSDLNITDLNIQGNKASLCAEYNFSTFNVKTSKNISGGGRRFFSLIKENGSWKITLIQNEPIEF